MARVQLWLSDCCIHFVTLFSFEFTWWLFNDFAIGQRISWNTISTCSWWNNYPRAKLPKLLTLQVSLTWLAVQLALTPTHLVSLHHKYTHLSHLSSFNSLDAISFAKIKRRTNICPDHTCTSGKLFSIFNSHWSADISFLDFVPSTTRKRERERERIHYSTLIPIK